MILLLLLCGFAAAQSPNSHPLQISDITELDLSQLLGEIRRRNLYGIHQTLPQGEWMVAYELQYRNLSNLRNGTSSTTVNAIHRNHEYAPLALSIQRHEVHLMHGLTDQTTLFVTAHHALRTMEHEGATPSPGTNRGVRYDTQTVGLSDSKVGALITFARGPVHQADLKAGVSLPSGAIDERDNTVRGTDQILPYAMQLGSGTTDLLPGLTYLGITERWSWGMSGQAEIRLGQNYRGYRLGNRVQGTLFASRVLTAGSVAALRLDAVNQSATSGEDSELSPRLAPTENPDFMANARLEPGASVNIFADHGPLAGFRFTAGAGMAAWQWTDGPQLGHSWYATSAVSWTRQFEE